jgi:hypothetical protein
MAEWFKAHAWKVCVLSKVPRVRIPVSPKLTTYEYLYFKKLLIVVINNND